MWTAAAIGMASGLGRYSIALAAAGVAVVVLYVVGVIQWFFRGRSDPATTELLVRLESADFVEGTRRAACESVGPTGTVVIDKVGRERSMIRVIVAPVEADSIIVRLAALDGVVRVTRSRP